MRKEKNTMDKKIGVVAVLAVIAVVAGILVFKKPSTTTPPTTTNNNNDNTTNTNNSATENFPGVAVGSMSVKVTKVVGSQVFYMSAGKETSVTVDSSTKIVKQVNDNGIFKDVTIKFSDIKTGQIIEITPGKTAGSVKNIRVLQ